jgi:hypothetical protein
LILLNSFLGAVGTGDSLVIPAEWGANWAWGLPLIVLTVIIHVFGLGLIQEGTLRLFTRATERRYRMASFATIMGTTTLLATSLHALEANIWAAFYRFLNALPDYKSSMLYSLNAMTSYGHENLNLGARWQLMGAIEALNGWLLFGLTTAFLFGMIQKIWSLERGKL